MLTKIHINGKTMFLIGLGYEPHFNILDRNLQKVKQEKLFWVYDKAKLDIAFYLSGLPKIPQNPITYITRINYQTVEVKQKFTTPKNLYQQNRILDIILNYDFSIKKTFCDFHPLASYGMICKYLNVKTEENMVKIFKMSFSDHQLCLNGTLIELMNETRKKYLDSSGLKLRYLERKATSTIQEAQQTINKWKEHYQIQKIQNQSLYQVSQAEWFKKIQWLTKNRYGFQVQKQLLLQGFGRKYRYAPIK